jgi:hypothetical protein
MALELAECKGFECGENLIDESVAVEAFDRDELTCVINDILSKDDVLMSEICGVDCEELMSRDETTCYPVIPPSTTTTTWMPSDGGTTTVAPSGGGNTNTTTVAGGGGASANTTTVNAQPTTTVQAANTSTTTTQLRYGIKMEAAENGKITPSGTVSVAPGQSVVITFVPDAGYKLKTATVDGEVVVTVGNVYVITNVREDKVVAAEFEAE